MMIPPVRVGAAELSLTRRVVELEGDIAERHASRRPSRSTQLPEIVELMILTAIVSPGPCRSTASL